MKPPHRSPLATAALLRQQGMTLLEVMLVVAIIAVVMGFLIGPKILDMFRSGEKGAAQILVQKFAYEAYPQWAVANTGKQCPQSLDELKPYMNTPETKDNWGNELVMLCGEKAPEPAKGFGVVSKGPDGKLDTGDDIKSWEQKKGDK